MNLNEADETLAGYRNLFDLPEGVVYLDGNSLGPPLKVTAQRLANTVQQEWARDLIASWNLHGWFESSARLAGMLSPLIGAQAREVAICDSISVNLFKLIAAALDLRPDRRVILADRRNFPTDLYMADGVARMAGAQLRLVDSVDQMADALDDATALLMASHVDFKSGRIHDMQGLTAIAHAHGALALWDLAHSAGALPVDLHEAGADLAVGCTYKYLNGGPGAPAFLFVAERHHAAARQPLSGWFGHRDPFAFDTQFEPAAGISRFLTGTPPILAIKALEAGLDVASRAPIEAIRAKSIALGEHFLARFEADLDGHGFILASPRDPNLRGSQISFAHEHGFAIMQALIADRVIGDFRAPDNLRFGFAPLYLSRGDIDVAIDRLVAIMREGRWRDPRFYVRGKVT